MTEACRCPGPSQDCRRAGLPMLGRLFELCRGINVSPGLSEAYRRLWDEKKTADREQPVRQGDCFHLGAVIDRRDSTCSRKWLMQCSIHGQCTAVAVDPHIQSCEHCKDWTD
jgi:hypothetical protein